MATRRGGFCAKASEESNLFKRYLPDNSKLGPHERNGFVAIIVLVLFALFVSIVDLAVNGTTETFQTPISAMPHTHMDECEKLGQFESSYLQVDVSVTSIVGKRDYGPEEDHEMTLLSRPGCEVGGSMDDLSTWATVKDSDTEKCKVDFDISKFAVEKPAKVTRSLPQVSGSRAYKEGGCSNSCWEKGQGPDDQQSSGGNNGVCEDGGKEDVYKNRLCAYGMDCDDCGGARPVACGLLMDDDNVVSEMTRDDFQKAQEARVLKKDTCDWHTLQLCAGTTYDSAYLVGNLREDYQEPAKWRGSVFHVETNISNAVVLKICPTLPDNAIDNTGWLRKEHGPTFAEQASGRAAGPCAKAVLGSGEIWAATFGRKTATTGGVLGVGGATETHVIMTSLTFLGQTSAVWDDSTASDINTKPEEAVRNQQSRTLLVLREPSDVRVAERSRVLSVFGGLGGIFTIVVGVVGVFVNVCAAARPRPGFAHDGGKDEEKRGQQQRVGILNEGGIEMQENPSILSGQ